MRRFPCLCGAALLLLAALTSGVRAAEPVKIRIGWGVPPPSELLPIIFEPGTAKHRGVTYELDDKHFRAATLQIMAFANSDLDMGLVPSTVFALAVRNGGLDDLRYLADEFMDGVPGYFSNQFMVLNDAPIHRIEDLKGKVLATNAIGGPGDLIIRTMLRRHGLEFNTDYTVIEAVFSTMQPLLLDHKADLVMITQPFYSNPALRQSARSLFNTEEAFGTLDLILWVARKNFIAEHRAAIVDLLEDYVRASHWYQDPANHAKAISIIAKFNKVPEATQDYLFTREDGYRNPDQIPDEAALQRTVDAQVAMGVLKEKFDITRYAELAPIAEAAKHAK